MTQNEIMHIKTLVELSASKGSVYWMPDESTSRKVVRVGKHKEEYEVCGIFSNGEFVALDNCEITDFCLAKRLKDQP